MRKYIFLWAVVLLGLLSQEAASQKVVAKDTLKATLVPVNPDTIPDYFNDVEAGYFGDRITPVYDDPEWEYARILGEREKVIIAVNAKIEKRRKEREAIGVQFTPTIASSTATDYSANFNGSMVVSPLSRYGIASYYDRGLHGKLMANGRPYNMYDPNIAASWEWPLGTRVMVTDTRTGRSITVTIQDRGPHQRLGRLIDLSNAASMSLAPDHSRVGLIPVRVTPLMAIPTGKMSWPTTSRRISQWPRSGHQAVDIDGQKGDPIFACESGMVSYAGWLGDHGNRIVVDHTNGLSTTYGHLDRFVAKPGDYVRKGQTIGSLGNTGHVIAGPGNDGSHLHFEVQIDGTKVNPLEYLK